MNEMTKKTISPQAALIYVMVMVSASDREMGPEELRRIGDAVRHLPIFMNFDPDHLVDTAKECAVMISAHDGLERTLAVIRSALPDHLCETAYALACDIAAADGKLVRTELRMLDLIIQRLGSERLTAAAIERAAHARYAVL